MNVVCIQSTMGKNFLGNCLTARNELAKEMIKTKTHSLKLLVLACSMLVVLVQPVHAKDATIKDMIVNNSSNKLLLYLTVIEAFTDDMEKGIQNGIPATFTYYVNLYKIRKGWLDTEVDSHTFTRTLTYDNLKEEYNIGFSEKDNKPMTVTNLDDAKVAMTELNGIQVTSLDNLTPGSSYILKVKASLAKKTLPLYFHYLIPFWRLWDFETDWHYVEFRY